MIKYRLTAIGLIISIALYLIISLGQIDLFEWFVTFLGRFEEYELDEIIIPWLIFMVFLMIDTFRRQRSHAVQEEKMKVYKAMLNSSYHVLNNFLNQMFLFKLTAEHTKGFPPDIIEKYDEIMEDTRSQLEALGSLKEENLDESAILTSVRMKQGVADN